MATLSKNPESFKLQKTASSKSLASAPSIVTKGTFVRSFLGWSLVFKFRSLTSVLTSSLHSVEIKFSSMT